MKLNRRRLVPIRSSIQPLDGNSVYVSRFPFTVKRTGSIDQVKVRVVGFKHKKFKTDSIVKKRVNRVLSHERGAIYSEFENGKNIDQSSIHAYTLTHVFGSIHWIPLIFAALRDLKSLFRKSVNNASSPQLSKPILKGPLSRFRFVSKEVKGYERVMGMSSVEFSKGMHLLTTGRSLLMAAAIVDDLRSNRKKSATIEVGGGHMYEIQRFIQNPDLALRYIRKMIRGLNGMRENLQAKKRTRTVTMLDYVVTELKKAELIFASQKKGLD